MIKFVLVILKTNIIQVLCINTTELVLNQFFNWYSTKCNSCAITSPGAVLQTLKVYVTRPSPLDGNIFQVIKLCISVVSTTNIDH